MRWRQLAVLFAALLIAGSAFAQQGEVMKLKFQQVPNASGYRIFYAPWELTCPEGNVQGQSPALTLDVGPGAFERFDLEGLQPSRDYWVTVKAIDAAGNLSGDCASVAGSIGESFLVGWPDPRVVNMTPSPPSAVAGRPGVWRVDVAISGQNFIADDDQSYYVEYDGVTVVNYGVTSSQRIDLTFEYTNATEPGDVEVWIINNDGSECDFRKEVRYRGCVSTFAGVVPIRLVMGPATVAGLDRWVGEGPWDDQPPPVGECTTMDDCPPNSVCMNGECLGPNAKRRARMIQFTQNERTKERGTQGGAATPEQSWVTLGEFQAMADAGATGVELHIITWGNLWTGSGPNLEYFTRWVDTWVDWAEEAGLAVGINLPGLPTPGADWCVMPPWVWQAAGSPNCPTGNTVEQARVVHEFWDLSKTRMNNARQQLVLTWAYIAERYKDRPHVFYMPINEPLHHTWQQIRTQAQVEALKAGYKSVLEDIVEAIRGTGAEQLIAIDWPRIGIGTLGIGNNIYAHVPNVEGENIAWIAHPYYNPPGMPLSQYEALVKTATAKFVTEFGRPYFAGEYAIENTAYHRTTPSWTARHVEMISVLDAEPMVGRSFHGHQILGGNYCSVVGGQTCYEGADREFILDTIFQQPLEDAVRVSDFTIDTIVITRPVGQ